LVALERYEEAVPLLETVLASSVEVPDEMMRKYGIGGVTEVSITPDVTAALPHSSLAAALLLAELYQRSGQSSHAAELLESLGAAAPDALFALSLADLYAELGNWDDVIRVSDGFTANADDATCQLLVYRAKGLRSRGMNDGALELLKEALKSKKRSPEVLKRARYERS
jgi:thioredoxin-like negative regulator of GroEL